MSMLFRSLALLLLAVPLAASPAVGQYQALAHGERVISVGPPIPPKQAEPDSAPKRLPAPPCTVDCEKAANRNAPTAPAAASTGDSVLQINRPQNNVDAAVPADKPDDLPAPPDLAAQLREATANFQHDLNQANQRIDHLTKQLQLCEQAAAKQAEAKPALEKLQATIEAMRKAHAEELAAADVRLKTLVDEVSAGLASKREMQQQREQALKSKLAEQMQSLQKQAAAAKMEAIAKAEENRELAEQFEATKKLHAQNVTRFGERAEEMRALMIEKSHAVDAASKQVRELRGTLANKLRALEDSLATTELMKKKTAELEKQSAAMEKEHQAALDQLKQANKRNESLQRRQKSLEKELTALKRNRDSDRRDDKKRKPKKKRDDK